MPQRLFEQFPTRSKISGATDGDLNDLMAKGSIKLEKIKAVELPRKADWLGW